jgi:Cu2+-exporting ATPase/Cu+-exporting ATPase
MKMTHAFPVVGMHCASCGAIITRTLKKEKGIEDVQVSPGTEKAVITYDSDLTAPTLMNKTLKPLGYSLTDEQDHMHHDGATDEMQEKIFAMSAFGLSLITFIVMFWEIFAESTVPKAIVHPLHAIVASIMLFGFGRQFLVAILRFMKIRVANMDTLVGIGTGVAYLYSILNFLFPAGMRQIGLPDASYFDVTIIVIGFVLFGKYLEMRAKRKTGEALEALMKLQVKTALVERDGKTIEIPIEDVVVGDSIHIKPGSAIPVDGVLLSSYASIDESLMTGESMPVDKKKNDLCIGGTINVDTAIVIKATKVGSDTVLSHIIQMVEDAQNSKAPIERLTDQVSAVFFPVVLGIAVLTFILWMVFGGLIINPILPFALSSFIGILVIACPCALGLATPTAVITAVGRAARSGILIKDAESLEALSRVNTIFFDKTGTITEGKPAIKDIKTLRPAFAKASAGKPEDSRKSTLQLLASLEDHSEHPIGKAIVAKAKEESVSLLPVTRFKSYPGRGIEGSIQGLFYSVGNARFMEERGVKMNSTKNTNGQTMVYVAKKTELIGVATLSDTPKNEARSAIQKLSAMGIQTIMLSGDDRETALAIARQVGMTDVIADVLPEDKLKKINELKARSQVAMVGDGVNDAPALASAHVGIAMATGTDAAMATAGITILHGDIEKVVSSIILARKTMQIIRQNLFWAFFYNVIGIPFAAGVFYPLFGIQLSPVFAGAAMALSSVTVVSNSLRLKTVKIV